MFLKVFGHASLIDIQNRFSDVGDFCLVCSRLLVNEISKRGHDDLGDLKLSFFLKSNFNKIFI